MTKIWYIVLCSWPGCLCLQSLKPFLSPHTDWPFMIFPSYCFTFYVVALIFTHTISVLCLCLHTFPLSSTLFFLESHFWWSFDKIYLSHFFPSPAHLFVSVFIFWTSSRPFPLKAHSSSNHTTVIFSLFPPDPNPVAVTEPVWLSLLLPMCLHSWF